MSGIFQNSTPGLSSPGIDVYAITPSDTADLPVAVRSIWVPEGERGETVRVTTLRGADAGGDPVALPAALLAERDVIVTRVWATGTTATVVWGIV